MKVVKAVIRIFILTNLLNICQAQISDSLNLTLKNSKHDTTTAQVLIAIGEQIYFQYPDSALILWGKANDISEKGVSKQKVGTKEYLALKKAIGASLNNIGFVYTQQSDINKALKYYAQSMKIRAEIGDKQGVAETLNNIGYIYQNQDDIPNALKYYHQSIKIKEEINDKGGLAYSLNNIALIYNNQGDIQKALDFFHRVLKIQEELGDKRGIALALNNIGHIFQNQGDMLKAFEFTTKSLKIREEIGDKQGISYSLNNIGSYYQNKGDYIKALEYFNKSLMIQEEIGDKKAVAISLHNIGFAYEKLENLAKALTFYNKSVMIKEEIGDKAGLALSFNNLGSIYLKQNELSKALQYLQKSLDIAKELGSPEKISFASKNLYEVYKKMGNTKLALENYEYYILMHDSINNEATHKASIRSQFKYEYEKKAIADSIRIADEKKIVAAQLKYEKSQRFALYGGLVLVALFGVFMFNRFRVTNKQKKIIELKEKETQQQNKIIIEQKNVIEERHKEITDSINYTERIQRSFMATSEFLDANLSEYFLIFKPKDVVSGDFYWAATLNNGNFALLTADSTGHGVPGAIMSLLNISSVEKAIETYTNPSEILNATRNIIIERLKKDGSVEGGKDGMDCSLCVYDFKKLKLYIASAQSPVWIMRAGEVIEIKPDKMPVGKHDKQHISFTLKEFDLRKGDVIYTLTDGFSDQFGGSKGKKFMSKNLRELLAKNAHLPLSQQKEMLENILKNWIGNMEQVDDITLFGIRI